MAKNVLLNQNEEEVTLMTKLFEEKYPELLRNLEPFRNCRDWLHQSAETSNCTIGQLSIYRNATKIGGVTR